MKAILGTIALFSFQISSISAQLFAPLGAKWTFNAIEGTNYSDCHAVGSYTMEVSEERQVDGRTVTVLPGYNGDLLIFNDTNQVYYFEDDSFYLLMDFSLTEGDTLYHRLPSIAEDFNPSCYCFLPIARPLRSIVVKDTFVIIEADTLKQLRFDSYWADTLFDWPVTGDTTIGWRSDYFDFTERIGQFEAPIFTNPIDICYTVVCCSDIFVCYEDNEITYERYSNCQYTDIEQPLKSELDVFPNPTNGTLSILFPDEQLKIQNISVLDVSGKTVHQSTEDPINPITIYIQHLSSGFYLCQITFSNGQSVVKKVIME